MTLGEFRKSTRHLDDSVVLTVLEMDSEKEEHTFKFDDGYGGRVVGYVEVETLGLFYLRLFFEQE